MAINMHQNSPLGANKIESSKQSSDSSRGSDVLDGKSEKVKLDKSNIMMLGPTGSGLYYSSSYTIFSYVRLYLKFAPFCLVPIFSLSPSIYLPSEAKLIIIKTES